MAFVCVFIAFVQSPVLLQEFPVLLQEFPVLLQGFLVLLQEFPQIPKNFHQAGAWTCGVSARSLQQPAVCLGIVGARIPRASIPHAGAGPSPRRSSTQSRMPRAANNQLRHLDVPFLSRDPEAEYQILLLVAFHLHECAAPSSAAATPSSARSDAADKAAETARPPGPAR